MTLQLFQLFENHEKEIVIEVFLEGMNEKLLLERWNIQKENLVIIDEEEDDSVGKAMTLMRSLFTTVLTMPSYTIYKKKKKGNHLNYKISYQLLNQKSSDEFPEDGVLKNQFEKIPRQKVAFSLDVEYLKLNSILSFMRYHNEKSKYVSMLNHGPVFAQEESFEEDDDFKTEFEAPYELDSFENMKKQSEIIINTSDKEETFFIIDSSLSNKPTKKKNFEENLTSEAVLNEEFDFFSFIKMYGDLKSFEKFEVSVDDLKKKFEFYSSEEIRNEMDLKPKEVEKKDSRFKLEDDFFKV
eukprot:gene11041-3747_t